jgi:hypothetical protein
MASQDTWPEPKLEDGARGKHFVLDVPSSHGDPIPYLIGKANALGFAAIGWTHYELDSKTCRFMAFLSPTEKRVGG